MCGVRGVRHARLSRRVSPEARGAWVHPGWGSLHPAARAAEFARLGQGGVCPPGPLELRHLRGVRVTQMRSQRGRFPPCRSSCGVCARVRGTAMHREGRFPSCRMRCGDVS